MKKLVVHMKVLLNILICMIGKLFWEKELSLAGIAGNMAFRGNSRYACGNKSYGDSDGRAISEDQIRKKRKSGGQKKYTFYFDRSNQIKHLSENRRIRTERAPCREQDRRLFSVHNIS